MELNIVSRQHRFARDPISLFGLEKHLLFILDMIGLTACYALAFYAFRREVPVDHLLSWGFGLVLITNIVIFYLFDLYKSDTQIAGLRPPGRAVVATLLLGATLSLFFYMVGHNSDLMELLRRRTLAVSMSTYMIWTSASRYYLCKWIRQRTDEYNWLAIGSPEDFEHFYRDMQECSRTNKVLFVFPEEEDGSQHFPNAGSWKNLEKLLREPWAGVIVGEAAKSSNQILKILMNVRMQGIRIFDLVDFYERVWFKIPVHTLKDHWLATTHGFYLIHDPIGFRIKSVLDVFFAVLLFIITLPLMIVIGLIIKLSDGGPAIYKQERNGQFGKVFTMYKFRSMVVNAEKQGAQWASKKDPRVTKVGRILRLTRLDELPQLFNVLKGEMSFIGPRPERPSLNVQLAEAIPYYNLRHLVKPGISGWAQVLFPYGASVEDAREKLQYDLFYIKNYKLLLDVAIAFKTVRVILLGRGR